MCTSGFLNTDPISLVSIDPRPQSSGPYDVAVKATRKLLFVSFEITHDLNHARIMVPFSIATGDFPSTPPPRGRVRSFTATLVLNPTMSWSAFAPLDDN